MLLSWNWSVNLVLPLPTFSNHSRHRRTELDSCCLGKIPIRFGTMMNDYREVVAVLKDRGRVLPSNLFRIVLSGSNPGFLQTFIDIDGD
jgi:hypothetical protein